MQLRRALQHPLPVTSWVDPPFTGVETFKLSSGGKVIGGLLVNVRWSATDPYRNAETTYFGCSSHYLVSRLQASQVHRRPTEDTN